eukprot:4143045-Ditylum_brightwellii.AAC.1
MKLQQPLSTWTTRNPYTKRPYYYTRSTNQVYALRDGLFHIYTAGPTHVTWFHATNNTCPTLPENASFQTVQKFRTTILCKGLLTAAEDTACSDLLEATNSYGSFDNFFSHQPRHEQHLLGNLDTAQVNVEYWIDTLNRGIVTIATDGSVLNKKGYFATVLHTDQR